MQQSKSGHQLTRHQIPTHLNVPDKLISFWGFGLTVRQLLVLLFGWGIIFQVWSHLHALVVYGTPGMVTRVILSAIPGLLTLVVAFKHVADRPLETWLLVLLRYWAQPKVSLWRSINCPTEEKTRKQHGDSLLVTDSADEHEMLVEKWEE